MTHSRKLALAYLSMCIYIGSVEYATEWVHVYETMGVRTS